MKKVRVIIKNLQRRLSLRPQKIKKLVHSVLSWEGIKKSGQISIYFVNDAQIKKLNTLHLKRNEPTDVIAFDISLKKDKLLADIFVSAETALENARIFNTTFLYEVYLYVIHGLLHILGYRHKRQKERQPIGEKEKKYLCLFTRPKP